MTYKFYILSAIWQQIWAGTLVTLRYTAIAVIFSIIWGIIIGSVTADRVPILSRVCRGYVTFFRETPLLVQMYIIFYGLPQLGIMWSAAVCGVLALVLNDGAFISEIVRGGLQSIEKGQSEAASALGFTRFQTWYMFLFPQAWKKVTESIMNMVSIILKDTSLLALITITELTSAAQKANTKHFEPVTVFLTAGVIYFALYLVLQFIKKLALMRKQK